MAINYFDLPSNLHYYEGGNVKNYALSDPNYFEIWSEYKKENVDNYLNVIDSIQSNVGKIISLDALQELINRTILNRVDMRYFIVKNKMPLEDLFLISATSTISEYAEIKSNNEKSSKNIDIPTMEEYELGRKSIDGGNLYCLHHAIYQAGELQKKQQIFRYKAPITVNNYPKSMKNMIMELVKKIYGDEHLISTNGKDFDFVSVVDSFGRSEVMMFVEKDDIIVPTRAQVFECHCMLRDYIEHQKQVNYPQVWLEIETKRINERNFETRGISFFDMTYSIRVIMSAIKSIQDGRIVSINENIPMHPLTEIIKKYPILTEIANNPNKFHDKLSELSVVAKEIQAEYDYRNIRNMWLTNFDFNKTFYYHNLLQFFDCSAESIFEKNLTDEDRKIVNDALSTQQANITPPPVVNYTKEKFKNFGNEWIQVFIRKNSQEIHNLSSQNMDFVSAYKKMESIKSFDFNINALKLCDFDFQLGEDNPYKEQIDCLNFIQNLNYEQIVDPIAVLNKVLENVEVTSENKDTIDTIKRVIISEVCRFNEEKQNANDVGSKKWSYNKLSKAIFFMKLLVSDKNILNKKIVSKTEEYKIPMEYFDFAPLYDMIDNLIESGVTEYLDIMTNLFEREELSQFTKFSLTNNNDSNLIRFLLNSNQNKVGTTCEKEFQKLIDTFGLSSMSSFIRPIFESLYGNDQSISKEELIVMLLASIKINNQVSVKEQISSIKI